MDPLSTIVQRPRAFSNLERSSTRRAMENPIAASLETLYQSLVDKGLINEKYELQFDRVTLPPAVLSVIENFLPYQEFMTKKISYSFQVSEEDWNALKGKLLWRIKEDSEEFTKIHLFLEAIKDKTFALKCSFKDVLQSYQDSLDKTQCLGKIEMIGGWVFYILTHSPEIFNHLLKKLLEANEIETQMELHPHVLRYRPEMDLKIYFANLSKPELLCKNDQFLEHFIRLFKVDESYEIYYYRELFKAFLPKASIDYPETFLGHNDHKLDVFFTSEKGKPLLATDRVTFTVEPFTKIQPGQLIPVSTDSFGNLRLTYTAVEELYQCLINLLFEVDQVVDPSSVNDKGIVRIFSKSNFGILINSSEINACLNNGKAKRKLSELFLDYHLNHHEKKSAYLIGLIVNGFFILSREGKLEMAETLWSDLRQHVSLEELDPFSKKIYGFLDQNLTTDALSKNSYADEIKALEAALSVLAYFEKDCQVFKKKYDGKDFSKAKFSQFFVISPRLTGIELVDLILNLKNSKQLAPFFDETWLRNEQKGRKETFEEAVAFIKKLHGMCFAKNANELGVNLIKKICETYTFPPIRSLAKKLHHQKDLRITFIEQFISCEKPISTLAYQAFFTLEKELAQMAFKEVMRRICEKSISQAISFTQECLDKDIIGVEQANQLFQKFDKTKFESLKAFFDFSKGLCEKYLTKLQLGEKPSLFEAQAPLLQALTEKSPVMGMELMILLKNQKLISTKLTEELIQAIINAFFKENDLWFEEKNFEAFFKKGNELFHHELLKKFMAHPHKFDTLCQKHLDNALFLMERWVLDPSSVKFFAALLSAIDKSIPQKTLLRVYALINSFLDAKMWNPENEFSLNPYTDVFNEYFQEQFPIAFEILKKSVEAKMLGTKKAQILWKGMWEAFLRKDCRVQNISQCFYFMEWGLTHQFEIPFSELLEKLFPLIKESRQKQSLLHKLKTLMAKAPYFESQALNQFLSDEFEKLKDRAEPELYLFFATYEKNFNHQLYNTILRRLCELYLSEKSYEEGIQLLEHIKKSRLNAESKTELKRLVQTISKDPQAIMLLRKFIFNPESLQFFDSEREFLKTAFAILNHQENFKESFNSFFNLVESHKLNLKSEHLTLFFLELSVEKTLRNEELEEIFLKILAFLIHQKEDELTLSFLKQTIHLPFSLRSSEKNLDKIFHRALAGKNASIDSVLEKLYLIKKMIDKSEVTENKLHLYQTYLIWLLRQSCEGYEKEVLDEILCYIQLAREIFTLVNFLTDNKEFISLLKIFYYEMKHQVPLQGMLDLILEELSNLKIEGPQSNKEEWEAYQQFLGFLLTESKVSNSTRLAFFESYQFYDVKCLRMLLTPFILGEEQAKSILNYYKLFELHLTAATELDPLDYGDYLTILAYLMDYLEMDEKWLTMVMRGVMRLCLISNCQALKHSYIVELQSKLVENFIKKLDEAALQPILTQITEKDLASESFFSIFYQLLDKTLSFLKQKPNEKLYRLACEKLNELFRFQKNVLLFQELVRKKNSLIEQLIFLRENYPKDFFRNTKYSSTMEGLVTYYLWGEEQDVEKGLAAIYTYLPYPRISINNEEIISFVEKGLNYTRENEIRLGVLLTILINNNGFEHIRDWFRSSIVYKFRELFLKYTIKLYQKSQDKNDLKYILRGFQKIYLKLISKESSTELLQSFMNYQLALQKHYSPFYSSVMGVLILGALEDHLNKVALNALNYIVEHKLFDSKAMEKILYKTIVENILNGETECFKTSLEIIPSAVPPGAPSYEASDGSKAVPEKLPKEKLFIREDAAKTSAYDETKVKNNFNIVLQSFLYNHILSNTIHSNECKPLIVEKDLSIKDYNKKIQILNKKMLSFFYQIEKLHKEFNKDLAFFVLRLSSMKIENSPSINHQYLMVLEMLLTYVVEKLPKDVVVPLIQICHSKALGIPQNCLYYQMHLNFFNELIRKFSIDTSSSQSLTEEKLIELVKKTI